MNVGDVSILHGQHYPCEPGHSILGLEALPGTVKAASAFPDIRIACHAEAFYMTKRTSRGFDHPVTSKMSATTAVVCLAAQ